MTKHRFRFVLPSMGLLSLGMAFAPAHFPFVVPNEGGATAKFVMSETLAPDAEVKIDLLTDAKLSSRDAAGVETPIVGVKGDNAFSLALPGSGTRVVHGVADLGVMLCRPTTPPGSRSRETRRASSTASCRAGRTCS